MDQMEEDELLYRLDERTKRIEEEHLRRLDAVEGQVSANRGAIETLDNRVQRNETLITIMTGGLGAIGAAVAAKFGAVMNTLRHLI